MYHAEFEHKKNKMSKKNSVIRLVETPYSGEISWIYQSPALSSKCRMLSRDPVYS